MSVELDTALPSVRIIGGYIREKKDIEFQLTTNEKLTGQIRWQDPLYIGVADAAGKIVLVSRHAIAYLHEKA
ncbi:MAG: RNA-binding protein hfq [Cyanobacteria bacterium]|nr:RNA-binding protein hfq [Cyanobacteriota bacterium]MDW8202203.1 RNA-binding protein hfq [Cyanobacteriota bacterium SKYGB_h_bin112]